MACSRWCTLIGCSLAFLLAATPLGAQEKKGQGGRGQRGGPGGGGAVAASTDSKLGLLGLEQVQAEIKLADDQKAKVAELRKGISDAVGTARGGGGASLTPEERRKRATETQEKREKLTAEAEKKLDGILKPEQSKRLGEIYIQQRGARALKDETVAKTLKLSEEQLSKVNAAIQWGQDEQRKLVPTGGTRGGGRDPQALADLREKREKLQKDVEAKVLAALTDSQKEQFEKLKGSPFKLERGANRPAGGGQRGGGQGGKKADAPI